jgi:hypothetical protein
VEANHQPADKITRLLDALPGLVGGIDRAIIEQAGVKAPFVLVIFADGNAMHATNISPPAQAVDAIKALATAWDNEPPQATAI